MSPRMSNLVALLLFVLVMKIHQANADGNATSISIDTSSSRSRPMPDTLFGIFFEEINHAGVGGLWSELVINRGFEGGGEHSPSGINPWGIIGDERSIQVTTELSSCFERNKVALRMDVLCNAHSCPSRGVGVFNPGFGGMNIEKGKKYKVTLYARSSRALELSISFVGSDGKQVLDTVDLSSDVAKAKNWTKLEATLEGRASDTRASLRITTSKKGTVWLDQVSAMPVDTYMGHGFRVDLMKMLLNLKPGFLRFPGGCYVEGETLANAFRWKETIGPWEERPGHYSFWEYWSDDGLGYLEYLQLAEDLGVTPVWVINAGMSTMEQVNTTAIGPFVQEFLDSLEFAMGNVNSKWGSLRAKYGHPKPFVIKYVAIGNENCGADAYQGNYIEFYNAVKAKYPNIQVINNCDASLHPLNVSADLFDYHIYTDPQTMFSKGYAFDHQPRRGPKVFASEYAVNEPFEVNGVGTLMGALGEGDIVSMASYAPLFMHQNDSNQHWGAINYNSWQAFGIPSYWMQTFFIDSNGARLLDLTQSTDDYFIASAISYKSSLNNKNYIKVKIVNIQGEYVKVTLSFKGLDSRSTKVLKETILTSNDPYDFNSFDNPTKVFPKSSSVKIIGNRFHAILKPYSLTAFDLLN